MNSVLFDEIFEMSWLVSLPMSFSIFFFSFHTWKEKNAKQKAVAVDETFFKTKHTRTLTLRKKKK